MPLLAKALISAAIIMAVYSINTRNTFLSALLISLPLTSVLAMIWMHLGGQTAEQIADHSGKTFWYVIPSLPMFLILPQLLKAKVPFFLSLTICAIITALLYLGMDWVLKRYQIW